MVVMASTAAAGCAPPDEPARARRGAATVEPPRPAVISYVTPAFAQVPALAFPTPPVSALPPSPVPTTVDSPGVVPGHAPAAIPPGLGVIAGKIEHVMLDLDELVEASLQLQNALLRLRLRPKHPPRSAPPEPDLAELPVGL
jgi:hypothetical protein